MKTSKYKGVSHRTKNRSSGAKNWQCSYKGKVSTWETERDAAISYDKMRIKDGKAPVNILKPKISTNEN